jgi:hypothetical protein
MWQLANRKHVSLSGLWRTQSAYDNTQGRDVPIFKSEYIKSSLEVLKYN